MSEEKKGGFFRRMFKRVSEEGEDVSPAPVATPAEVAGEETPSEEPAKKGFFARIKDKMSGGSHPNVGQLSDQDIADIAAYFSSQG